MVWGWDTQKKKNIKLLSLQKSIGQLDGQDNKQTNEKKYFSRIKPWNYYFYFQIQSIQRMSAHK